VNVPRRSWRECWSQTPALRAPALIARGTLPVGQVRLGARAGADLKRARALAPDDAEVLLAEADLAQHAGGSADLQRRLAAYLKYPRDVRFLTPRWARLELAAGRRQAGIEALKDGLKVMARAGGTARYPPGRKRASRMAMFGEAARLIDEMLKNGGRAGDCRLPESADRLAQP